MELAFLRKYRKYDVSLHTLRDLGMHLLRGLGIFADNIEAPAKWNLALNQICYDFIESSGPARL